MRDHQRGQGTPGSDNSERERMHTLDTRSRSLSGRARNPADDTQIDGRLRAELRSERDADLQVAQQEGPLVKTPSAQPAGDFVVALAGVARAAGRHDVVERVTAATGDRKHAVALQRTVVRAAVRAPTPRSSQRHPLLGAEVVLNTLHPALSSAGGLSTAASTDNHAREPKQLARRSTRTIGNLGARIPKDELSRVGLVESDGGDVSGAGNNAASRRSARTVRCIVS